MSLLKQTAQTVLSSDCDNSFFLTSYEIPIFNGVGMVKGTVPPSTVCQCGKQRWNFRSGLYLVNKLWVWVFLLNIPSPGSIPMPSIHHKLQSLTPGSHLSFQIAFLFSHILCITISLCTLLNPTNFTREPKKVNFVKLYLP